MNLYLVHDADYNYRVVVAATYADEAIKKTQKWLEETKQNGELWTGGNVKWFADLCDNDVVIK